jgi:hypothetical protein
MSIEYYECLGSVRLRISAPNACIWKYDSARELTLCYQSPIISWSSWRVNLSCEREIYCMDLLLSFLPWSRSKHQSQYYIRPPTNAKMAVHYGLGTTTILLLLVSLISFCDGEVQLVTPRSPFYGGFFYPDANYTCPAGQQDCQPGEGSCCPSSTVCLVVNPNYEILCCPSCLSSLLLSSFSSNLVSIYLLL